MADLERGTGRAPTLSASRCGTPATRLPGERWTNALQALLEAEQQRGPDFLRLANAHSALYPRDSEEKRLLDAMLLALPRG